MSDIRITLRVPPELLERIDCERGLTARATWIKAVLEAGAPAKESSPAISTGTSEFRPQARRAQPMTDAMKRQMNLNKGR